MTTPSLYEPLLPSMLFPLSQSHTPCTFSPTTHKHTRRQAIQHVSYVSPLPLPTSNILPHAILERKTTVRADLLLGLGGSVLSDLLDGEAGGERLEELGGLLGVRDRERVEVSGASDLEPVGLPIAKRGGREVGEGWKGGGVEGERSRRGWARTRARGGAQGEGTEE